MEPWYIALFRKLPLDRKTAAALLPLVGRYGAKGAVVLARGYLGPVADQVEKGRCKPVDEPPAATANRAGLDEGEVAILGMALTKLLYEAGELALHNPTASASGKQPEFKLDEHGRPPAMSLSHVVAATRLWRAHSAETAAREQAERERELALAQAQAKARSAPRARLQAARGQLYALAPRYGYVPTSSTNRVPR